MYIEEREEGEASKEGWLWVECDAATRAWMDWHEILRAWWFLTLEILATGLLRPPKRF